jgi:hypothetical protein
MGFCMPYSSTRIWTLPTSLVVEKDRLGISEFDRELDEAGLVTTTFLEGGAMDDWAPVFALDSSRESWRSWVQAELVASAG